jgi:hypothetical protein
LLAKKQSKRLSSGGGNQWEPSCSKSWERTCFWWNLWKWGTTGGFSKVGKVRRESFLFFFIFYFLIEDFDGRSSPANFTFDKVAFWVQMVNLLLRCMGQKTRRMLGAFVGEVKAVDMNRYGVGWGESLRVKILIVVTQIIN